MEAELRAVMRARPGRTVLAIDESFFIKSLDAKRTRALRRLREWAGRAYVLCGTPAPNSPLTSFSSSASSTSGTASRDVDVPARARAWRSQVVQSAIEERGLFLRHLKTDVLPDLPVKRFQRVIVPMAEEQARLYRATLNGLVTDVAEAVDETGFIRRRTSFLARRAALASDLLEPGRRVRNLQRDACEAGGARRTRRAIGREENARRS